MGLFGFGKKRDVIDLTEYHRKQQARTERIKAEMQQETNLQKTPTDTGFGFFGAIANTISSSGNSTQAREENYPTIGNSESSDSDEKRRRLAKRLTDMTNKIEDLSNQIYHLQQRLEVMERKIGVSGF